MAGPRSGKGSQARRVGQRVKVSTKGIKIGVELISGGVDARGAVASLLRMEEERFAEERLLLQLNGIRVGTLSCARPIRSPLAWRRWCSRMRSRSRVVTGGYLGVKLKPCRRRSSTSSTWSLQDALKPPLKAILAILEPSERAAAAAGPSLTAHTAWRLALEAREAPRPSRAVY